MELTLEKAKELSAKKWKLLVENDGNERKVLEILPELSEFRSKCAMCEFVYTQDHPSCDCCLYKDLCLEEYGHFLDSPCSDTAEEVYNIIIYRNQNEKEFID